MNGLAWKIRFAFVAIAGIAGALVAYGFQSAVVVSAALLVIGLVLSILLERSLINRLRALQSVIERIYMDGDLTRRASEEGGDEVAATAKSFNKLMASFATIIGKVFFNSVEVAKASALLINEANTVAEGSNQQHGAALSTGSFGILHGEWPVLSLCFS